MQGMGAGVGKPAWPAGASWCAVNMPGTGWVYGRSVPHGVSPFEWGLGTLFCSCLPSDQEDGDVLWHFGQERGGLLI